jgi:hypothetical protein
VVGAGVAVSGLGTFGTFTDSTTPIDAEVGGGTVSIDVSDPGRLGTVPLDFGGVLPGSSTTQTVSLVNDGTSDLAAVTMTAVPTVSSVLDTDTTDGLQTTVRACSVPWSADATCLALTVSLPEAAGNEFAGHSSAVQFTFTAVQRSGIAR